MARKLDWVLLVVAWGLYIGMRLHAVFAHSLR